MTKVELTYFDRIYLGIDASQPTLRNIRMYRIVY